MPAGSASTCRRIAWQSSRTSRTTNGASHRRLSTPFSRSSTRSPRPELGRAGEREATLTVPADVCDASDIAGRVEVYLEKDEPVPVQPNLEDLLRAETDDAAEEALSLADFDDEQ